MLRGGSFGTLISVNPGVCVRMGRSVALFWFREALNCRHGPGSRLGTRIHDLVPRLWAGWCLHQALCSATLPPQSGSHQRGHVWCAVLPSEVSSHHQHAIQLVRWRTADTGVPVIQANCSALYLALHHRMGLWWGTTFGGLQIAGLDVGWGNRLDMALNSQGTGFVLNRELPPGKFNYKFIFDGQWSYSANHPTIKVRRQVIVMTFVK